MHSLNCLIVDDEPIARDIVAHYCSDLPYLNVVASCGNAIEARTVMKENIINILFLDIHMPVIDGIRFLSTLKNHPQVIFTTAYKEYAATAFDLYACDYLVKPFSLERFIVSVDKAIEKITTSTAGLNTTQETTTETQFFFLKSEGRIYKINYLDVLYAEANGNNTKIITTDMSLVSSTTFTNFQLTLPTNIFIRIHRSFIINKFKITLIEGNRLFIGKIEVPIGSNYRKDFFKFLNV